MEEHGQAPSVETAKETRVHLLDKDKEEFTNYSVFDCLGYELSYSGTPYVLSSGTWHQVVPQFLTRVNHYVDQIAKPPTHCQPGTALKMRVSTTPGAEICRDFSTSIRLMSYLVVDSPGLSSAISCTRNRRLCSSPKSGRDRVV